MPDTLAGYQTTESGPDDGGNVTVTEVVAEKKIALDTYSIGGTVEADPSDPISENPLTGSTVIDTGTVSTVYTDVPAVAGGSITSILLENPLSNDPKQLLISFDGGTTAKTLEAGSNFVWTPRGDLKQVKIKGSAAGTDYEIVINRNDP